VAEIWKRH